MVTSLIMHYLSSQFGSRVRDHLSEKATIRSCEMGANVKHAPPRVAPRRHVSTMKALVRKIYAVQQSGKTRVLANLIQTRIG
jgi:hypothetical protein